MRTLILAILAAAPVLAPARAPSATLRVPSKYVTINAALDAATAGDSVLVAPGVYDQYETRQNGDGAWISSVAFIKPGVTLCSEGGAEVTTLTMTSTAPFSSPRTVYRYNLAGPEFVLCGFTFTGQTLECLNCVSLATVVQGEGHARVEDCVFRDFGTGNDCEAALIAFVNLAVRRCEFRDINAAGAGALALGWGSLLLEDCEFVNCRSGAAWVEAATDLVVRRCRFLYNVRTLGGGGAFIAASNRTDLFEDCWFEGNQSVMASASGGAIALGGFDSDEVIRNCTFVGNYTTGHGGALYIHCRTAVVEGVTFWQNAQGIDWSQGGACIFVEGGDVTIRRNVIAGTTGDQAIGILQGTVHTACNVFWQNALGNASGFTLDPSDLEADPIFCDPPANDFHVGTASPCLPGSGYPSCTDLIGAWGEGCGTVAVQPETWGRIKSGFRSGSEGTVR